MIFDEFLFFFDALEAESANVIVDPFDRCSHHLVIRRLVLVHLPTHPSLVMLKELVVTLA